MICFVCEICTKKNCLSFVRENKNYSVSVVGFVLYCYVYNQTAKNKEMKCFFLERKTCIIFFSFQFLVLSHEMEDIVFAITTICG
jgi:hypothetical protein